MPAYDKPFEGISKPSFCDEVNCWDQKSLAHPQTQEEILKHFSGKPGGRYSAQELFDIVDGLRGH